MYSLRAADALPEECPTTIWYQDQFNSPLGITSLRVRFKYGPMRCKAARHNIFFYTPSRIKGKGKGCRSREGGIEICIVKVAGEV